jgi:hypothetical protein
MSPDVSSALPGGSCKFGFLADDFHVGSPGHPCLFCGKTVPGCRFAAGNWTFVRYHKTFT